MKAVISMWDAAIPKGDVHKRRITCGITEEMHMRRKWKLSKEYRWKKRGAKSQGVCDRTQR